MLCREQDIPAYLAGKGKETYLDSLVKAKTHKFCSICGNIFPMSEFYQAMGRKTSKKSYHRNQCKKCVMAQRRQRVESPPEKFLARTYSQLKSSRKRQGVTFELSLNELIEIYRDQKGKCAITGLTLTFKREKNRGTGFHGNDSIMTIDRINANGPYKASNVRMVCKRVNLMRGKQTTSEFVKWCEAVANPQFEHRLLQATGIVSATMYPLNALWHLLKGKLNEY